MSDRNLAGTFTFQGTTRTVHRMGYGAMQLAGPHVWGPPKDRPGALAVLREAVTLGIDHIDTADFYGPHVTNQLIREALQPYPATLTLVTKIGYKRGEDQSWFPAATPDELKQAVEDNLRNLGLDVLPVVNLRLGTAAGPTQDSLREPLQTLAALQQQGLVEHIGLSTISATQFEEAESIAPIVCVQNLYNVAHREDDSFLDTLAEKGVAYVPYFPLGGFSPLQSTALHDQAAALGATPMQVALAWLLQRSPNILLIPGTSSIAHLRDNLKAATLNLPPATLKALNAIAAHASS